MADLISPTAASWKIKTGLVSSPTADDIGCTGEVSISGESDVYEYACLGEVLKNKIVGAKSVTCSFSGRFDDALAKPVDLIASAGIYVGGPVSIIIDFGDTSNTTLTMSGYLSSFEYTVGGDANAFSGEIAVTSSP